MLYIICIIYVRVCVYIVFFFSPEPFSNGPDAPLQSDQMSWFA